MSDDFPDPAIPKTMTAVGRSPGAVMPSLSWPPLAPSSAFELPVVGEPEASAMPRYDRKLTYQS